MFALLALPLLPLPMGFGLGALASFHEVEKGLRYTGLNIDHLPVGPDQIHPKQV